MPVIPIFKSAAQWATYVQPAVAGGGGSDHLKLFTDILNALEGLSVNVITEAAELVVVPSGNAVAIPGSTTLLNNAIFAMVGEDATTGMPVSMATLLAPVFATGGTFAEKMALQAAANNADFANNVPLANLVGLTTNFTLNLAAGHNLSKVHFYYCPTLSTIA